MAKRIFIGLAIVCVLIIGFVIFMPNMRQQLFGARLAHNLQVGRNDQMITVAQLLSGNEIRPLSADSNPLPSPNVNTENYDVRLTMNEAVQSVGSEEVLIYNVTGVESEQIGTKGASDTLGNIYRLRLNPLGLPCDVTRTEGKQSHALDDIRITQILGTWWPGLPSKRVRQGDSWNSHWNVPLVVEVLDGKKINLRHELKYNLQEIKQGNGLNVAHLAYSGTVAPADWGTLPANTEIVGTGTIAGEAYINVTTGQTLVADERLIWSVAVRLKDQGMEVVQFADRNSRTYRPRFMPHGDVGFSTKSNGSTSAEGLPTAADMIKQAAPTGKTAK